MGYKDIKTEYVRNKVKNLSWNDSEYIDSLMYLESYVLGEIYGWAGNMKAHSLKNKYEMDYWQILKEINPKKFNKLYKEKIEEKVRYAKEQEQLWLEEQKAEEKAKREWIELGGKI